ncbi:MAG: NYN domain-containing protein [Gammaproteobacteria bacterium]|nr:NYN domain-containing protein [Gammaproteobacteria bacterium]MYF27352.1 NYN domain-containing protein [Gammaproteobacteria bacterium]MYK46104.1 NYN domain-containing protein [Gammaproteobacteria bacterium]
MDRVAVFVDAGYLFAEGSRALSGRKAARSRVFLDHAVAVRHLAGFARERAGIPLLRVYWYDGTANRPTRAQVAAAEQADVKLRLGRIDASGRQKGVDALIASDMVNLARNHAMTDCVLLAGDDELRIAVAEIQQLGIRVHLIGISPASRTQSRLLRQEADSTTEWDAHTLRAFMACRCRTSSRGVPQGFAQCIRGVQRGRVAPGPTSNRVRDIAQDVVRQVLSREFVGRTGRYPRSRDGRSAPEFA